MLLERGCGMIDVWVYRPDIESIMRKINRNCLYNSRGENYFEVMDRREETNKKIEEYKEKRNKIVAKTKMEVPYD